MLGSNFKRSIWGLGLIGFAWICFLGHAAEISTTRIKATDAQFGTMSSARATISQATISSATIIQAAISSAAISSATIERLNFSTISGPIINSTAYVSSYASLNAAVAAIGTTQTKLLVNEATTLTGNLSIPATLMVEVTRAGSINYGAYTLTFSGGNNSLQAGRYAIFAGTGTIAGLQKAYPEWWVTNTTPGTTAMQAGFTSALAACDVVDGEGTYALADTITLGDEKKLTGNMTLKAITGMANKPMLLLKEGDGSTSAWHVSIPDTVIIDGNDIALTGIEVYRARECKLSPAKITRVCKYGFLLGDSTSGNYSNGLDIYGTKIWYHEEDTPVSKGGSYANPSDSIGVYYRYCTDSVVVGVTATGFRVGFEESSNASAIRYISCHAWNRRAHGPLLACFRSYGSNSNYTQCYADTPHNWYSADGSTYTQDAAITAVYGWYHDSYSQAVVNSVVYMNPSATYGATDELLTALYFNKAGYGHVIGMQIKGASATYQYNKVYDGVTTNVTILGTGIPVSGSLADTASVFDKVDLRTVAFGGQRLLVDDSAEELRTILFKTAGVDRWYIGADDTAEAGSNAGSDFKIWSREDDGTSLAAPFEITRSTGYIKLNEVPTYANNSAAISGGMTAGQVYRTSTGTMMIVYTP